jgi:hypothetical protein
MLTIVAAQVTFPMVAVAASPPSLIVSQRTETRLGVAPSSAASRSSMARRRAAVRRAHGKTQMTRLQKFLEKEANGEKPYRTAYVLQSNSLPQAGDGMDWHVVETFSAADELLDNPDLKEVFKMAIDKGCAIVTPKAKGK